MFSKKEVIRAYDRCYEHVFRRLDDDAERVFGQRYTETHKWRLIRDILLLPKADSNSRILEIGPSAALPIIQQLTGARVEALCVDDLNRNFLDPYKISLHICDISRDRPALPNGSYDIILFCQVMEHFVLAPRTAFRTVLSLLKPGGSVLFSVPNFATVEKRMRLLRGVNPQDELHDRVAYYAHIREPVLDEARRWWIEAGAKIERYGFTDYEKNEPISAIGRLWQTAQSLRRRDWYRIARTWFPRTRKYFYLLLTK